MAVERRIHCDLGAIIAGAVQSFGMISTATGALISNINKRYVLSDDEIGQLIKAADIVTAARTGVERDFRGEVIDAALEMPTRFAKQLGQLVRGAVAIGMAVEDALRLAIRCVRDSIPPLRCEILLDIAAHQSDAVMAKASNASDDSAIA